MPIQETVSGDSAEINLDGKLTYADTSDFRKRLHGMLARTPARLVISMAGLSFMDSAGLGMLIVTLDECNKRGISLSLCQPQGEVKQLLQITRCYEKFNIVD